MIIYNGVLKLFVSILSTIFRWSIICNSPIYSINVRLLAALGSVAFAVSFLLIALRIFLVNKKKQLHKASGDKKLLHVGFFHPYCNAGGGGERVLWCAIRALLNK